MSDRWPPSDRGAPAERGGLAVIAAFHADYDRSMRQDEALGRLMIAGAFRPGDERAETRLLRVGAQMCGMIRDDVYLDTFSGKMRLLASSREAELLSEQAQTDLLARYVLTRWHDAAARIAYRIGNHTRAMTAAQAALELTEREPTLWWCWADVRSNQLRMRQEADTQVKRPPSVLEGDYEQAIQRAADLLTRHRPRASDLQHIEHLRGMWNLHHNRMVTRGSAQLEASLAEFKPIEQALHARRPDEETVDAYRQAQTLNQQALQLKLRAIQTGDRELIQRSIDCYERLQQMPWPRGRFFARQHLPHLRFVLDPAQLSGSIQQLLELCAEVAREQTGPGGREGFDLDRYYWTLLTARTVAGRDLPALRTHDLAVSRAIQAIASVSAYKNAAQRFVLPSLQREADRYLETIDPNPSRNRDALASIDAAVALIEEGSARELLDLLTARGTQSATQRAVDVFVPVAGLIPKTSSTAGSNTDPRNKRADLSAEGQHHIAEAVSSQRQREEAYWLANPLPTHGIDPEISHACRQFTAERFADGKGPLLIRFFQRLGGSYWAVAYFKGDTFGPVHILNEIAKDAPQLAELMMSVQAPDFDQCDRIWSLFFEPVFKAVATPEGVGEIERLTIVPCGDLFSLPLHVAAVPADWSNSGDTKLLCQWRPLSFSVSLASHVLRNRAAFRACTHHPDDDLIVLFAGEADYREFIEPVLAAAAEWPGSLGCDSADFAALEETIARKPEFFVLQCHGDILINPQEGSVLLLNGGVLSNFGIATRQWLPRNKVSILGACLSGRPARFADGTGSVNTATEIAGFIRGFIAAGCGALFVTNWSVRQVDLGRATEQIIRRIRAHTGVVQLDSMLKEIVDVDNPLDASITGRIEQSVFQLFL